MSREWDGVQTEYLFNLLREFGITNVFESGTFEGDTSLRFWELGFKVFTVENNPQRARLCRQKFRGTNIEFYVGDSAEYLAKFLMRRIPNVFYYLDAHQRGEELPLKKELQLLFTQRSFLAMVHDIRVFNQSQFTYGDDITYEFYSTQIPKDVKQIFPRYVTSPNNHLKHRTIGYCILSKGYPIIPNNDFTIT